jgi:hypothetical protein
MTGSAGSDRSSPPDSLTAAYNGLNNPQMFNTSMMSHQSSAGYYGGYDWQALQHRQMAASHNFAAAAVAAAAAVGHNGAVISSPRSAHSGTTANNSSSNVNNSSTSTSSSAETGHTGTTNATSAAGASSRSASSATAGGDSTSVAGTSNESSANINNANNDGEGGSSHNAANRNLSRNGFMHQAGNGAYHFDMMNPMCQPDYATNLAAAAAANSWAYPYPPYQFGGAPYGPGMVDITSFGKFSFQTFSTSLGLILTAFNGFFHLNT